MNAYQIIFTPFLRYEVKNRSRVINKPPELYRNFTELYFCEIMKLLFIGEK